MTTRNSLYDRVRFYICSEDSGNNRAAQYAKIATTMNAHFYGATKNRATITCRATKAENRATNTRKKIASKPLILLTILAEREGFEPSVGCPTQHFQCCTLRPLGHLSRYFIQFLMQYHTISSVAPYDHSDTSPRCPARLAFPCR